MAGTTDEESYDHLYKVVLLGDATVGKTNLLSRYIRNSLPKNPTATLGVEFATKTLQLQQGKVKAQIWDTAGQERYRSITSAHYKRAVGALLVFDITKKSSFQNCLRWMEELRNQAEPDIVIVLVGNKLDLAATREVSESDARDFAVHHGLHFSEASAFSGENVRHIFELLMQEIYNEQSKKKPRDSAEMGSGMALAPPPPITQQTCQC
mmetsp:Transcript_18699/g.45065  ORF Transcript_18699/g.45065 Transcript_18699/m.45065 type:complete len:209 (+) Transcript_18699:14-640(+)